MVTEVTPTDAGTPERPKAFLDSLPPHIRKIAEEDMAMAARIGLGPSHPDIVCALAWRKWAKSVSGDDLFTLIIRIRHQLFMPAHSETTVMIEEAALRLRGSSKTKRTGRAAPSGTASGSNGARP